jgi:hypothetical protein
MALIPAKVNIVHVFNEVTKYLNSLPAAQEIPRELQIWDVKCEIIHAKLIKAAERALAIGDKELIQVFMELGLIGWVENERGDW